ncbi:hypothetical protein ACWDE9_35235, partial [Streptomyces olivaceoviridis]
GDGLDETDRAWRVLRARWDPTVRELRRDRRDRAALRRTVAVDAWLLQLAREPERTRSLLTRQLVLLRAEFPERVPWFDALLSAQDDDLRLVAALLLGGRAREDAQELRHRRVVQEHERLLAADQDGLLAVLRRLDRLPTLGWALLGATAVTAPWSFVIGLADVLGRASQEAVVTAWLEALPAAAFVFVVELWTAVYIGPPFYHPGRSLAGLLIRSADRPARLARTRAGRYVAAALLVLAVVLAFYAIAVVPWLWPLASAAAVAVWSVRRGWAWRRLRREHRAQRTARRRGLDRRPDRRAGGRGGWTWRQLPRRVRRGVGDGWRRVRQAVGRGVGDRWRRVWQGVRRSVGDRWRRVRQGVRRSVGDLGPGARQAVRPGAGGRWRRWHERRARRVSRRDGGGRGRWRRARQPARGRSGTTTETTGEQK